MRSVKDIISSYTVDIETEPATDIKVPAHEAINIELIDIAAGHATQTVLTRRFGNNLLLAIGRDDFDHPDIVLEDYCKNKNIHPVGLDENGQYY